MVNDHTTAVMARLNELHKGLSESFRFLSCDEATQLLSVIDLARVLLDRLAALETSCIIDARNRISKKDLDILIRTQDAYKAALKAFAEGN